MAQAAGAEEPPTTWLNDADPELVGWHTLSFLCESITLKNNPKSRAETLFADRRVHLIFVSPLLLSSSNLGKLVDWATCRGVGLVGSVVVGVSNSTCN